MQRTYLLNKGAPSILRITRFLLLSMLAASAVAWATQTNCVTPPGAVVPDGDVDARASFTTGTGFVTVTLTDTLSDPRSVGQLLSGLAFTVSGGETAGTLGSSSADLRTVHKGGSFVDLGPSTTGWALAQDFNGGFELCVLCTDLGGAGPSHLLIGPPASSGTYASANGSIAGNGPHNPFTAQTATFLINVPDVTAISTITSATFFFSTTSGVSVNGACSAGIVIQPQ